MKSVEEINSAYNWTDWKLFPNPTKKEYLYAPFGAGVYQLRNKRTNQYVLFGESEHLAKRMSSLLPRPHGDGTRKAVDKREYVWDNIDNIEYRTVACETKEEARKIQAELKQLTIHIFNR